MEDFNLLLILTLTLSCFFNQGLSQISKSEDITWGLTNSIKNSTCILLYGFFEFAIPFSTDYGTRDVSLIRIPKIASVGGVCDFAGNPDYQEISLEWEPMGHSELGVKHSLTLGFIRKGTETGSEVIQPYFEADSLQARIYSNELEFPDAIDQSKVYNLSISNLGIMSAPVSLSYACKATQVIDFEDGVNKLTIANVHAEAFHNGSLLGDGKDFGPKSFCAKDGFEVILLVLTYVTILALIGLGIFYILDRKSKASYIYL